MNIKLKRNLYLGILAFVALSIIGLFPLLQNLGIMIGFDTKIIFLPLKWIMFILLGLIFWDLAKGRLT